MNGQKAGLLKQSIELIETLWNVNLLENTEITETEKN